MEFLRQNFSGAEEMTLHVADRYAQLCSNFIVGHFLIMPQFNDDSIARWQRRQRLPDLLASFTDFRNCFWALTFISVAFIIELRSDLSRLKMIQTQVGGH